MSSRFQFNDLHLIQAKPLGKVYKSQQKVRPIINTAKYILCIVLLGAISFGLFFQNTKPITSAAYNFSQSLAQKNFADAYQWLSPELQKRYDEPTFIRRITPSILTDSNSQTFFHTIKPNVDQAIVQGTIHTESVQTPLQLMLKKDTTQWSITSILIGVDPFQDKPETLLHFGP